MIIITRYDENLDWLKDYNFSQYLIYNKGIPLNDSHEILTENIGGNQRDIFKFIYDHYDNLPQIMAFIQGNPFDHCKKEVFDKLIYNDKFTSLEYYGTIPSNQCERRDSNGEYVELNVPWYIISHNQSFGLTCKYNTLDDFMNTYFTNYVQPEWIKFSPGSQYIIENWRATFYSRNFWYKLMNELNSINSTEAHIIERSLWSIFQCKLKERV